MPGADLVQIEYQSMELMDTTDNNTPIYGTGWMLQHHMYGVDGSINNFGSDGCEFESRRGRLYMGAVSGFAPIYWSFEHVFMTGFFVWCSLKIFRVWFER